ncbi:MAG: Rieske [2Fe-2S] protein [Paenibacillus sp.]|jgi:3-phenylpropionate/trans-cinnamate dioxygenase ferredoxin subunit|nr:Rieske [2Fe-2S] protein [Paenibacillus sp.]
MVLHEVGFTDEFETGKVKIVEVNGRKIGIYRLLNNELHAVLNICPHQGAELCKGPIRSWVSSPKPGVFEYDKEGEIVRCPWHAWEFDILTGKLVVDGKVRTKVYDVTVEKFDVSEEKGKVFVSV